MILWNDDAQVRARQHQIREEQGGHRVLSDIALVVILFAIVFLTYIL